MARRDTTHKTHRLRPDTAEHIRQAAVEVPTVSLLVYHRDGVTVVPLQPGGSLVVGRSSPADLVIDDRSLSRQHARFDLSRGGVEVEDLGSTNGTLVGGKPVERAGLRPGDTVSLGAVLITVHLRAAEEATRLGLESHDRFRDTLERALVSARYYDEELSLVFVRSAQPGAHVSGWLERAIADLRPVDSAALYSDEAVELLLPRTGAEAALGMAQAIAARHDGDAPLLCGVASYPGSATGVDQLLEAGQSAARSALSREPVRVAPSIGTGAMPSKQDAGPVIGSASMRQLFDTVARLGRSPIPVLLVGETGTGKEVIARAIHDRGMRARGPMVCVNCGAIPSQLVESTLFGHERGAFTGASKESDGVFGAAHGGTVLLDEIGELPAAAQSALLRVLEHKRMQRVGSAVEIDIEVRVIAATHRDLEAMCDAGSFRRDLWYRLNAMTLWIPPLRERVEELPSLVDHFLEQAMRTHERRIAGVTDEAMDRMRRYAWPGNLRELKNAIERAVVIARGASITEEDLPLRVRGVGAVEPAEMRTDPDELEEDDDLDLRSRVRRYEARLITSALEKTGGNKTHAARLLKIPVRTLVHKLKMLRGAALPS